MYHYLLWFELLSFLVALFNYRYLKGSNLIWFIPFLALTNIQEWGSRYGLFSINETNTVSLNIFTTIEFLFYTWLFLREISNAVFKKILLIAGAILLLSIIFNFLFLNGILVFHLNYYLAGSILMVLFACLYFSDLLKTEEYIELRKLPMFWICIGVLFFYTGTFFVYLFMSKGSEAFNLRYARLFNIVSNVFNIILYSCLIIAFLCSRSLKKIS